jgi:hypothetical protein
MVAGLVCGAAAGALAVAVLLPFMGGDLLISDTVIGALFGAPLGAVTAPLFSWLFLRRVPLGRMFLWCSIGTAIGGAAFEITGAFHSCLTTAIILNAVYAPTEERHGS